MSETLVDPSLVSVVGVVSTDLKAMKSPQNATKDKQKKHSTPVKKSSSTDLKLEAMDQNGLNVSVILKHYFCPSPWESQIRLFKL